MNTSKVVSRRKPPHTSEEFHALGVSLDRELSVVGPFARKRGFIVKARTWKDLVEWESRRALTERRLPLQ
jgi:hypothetical protein